MRMKTRSSIQALLLSASLVVAGCSSETTHDDASFCGDLEGRQADSSFVLAGDTQRTSFWEQVIFREQNDGPRTGIFKKIAEEEPGFVVLLGDIVDQGDDDREWRVFDGYAAPVRENNIPIYAALGNHDYWGDDLTALANFYQRFPHQKGATWTAVRFRSVAVLLLNSNFSQLSRAQIREQDRWYARQLSSLRQDPSISAIIVGCHHPPFTNSTVVSDDEDVQEHFVAPFMAEPKAMIFFTGHCHAYEHFIRGGKHFVVTGGGGGPRQALNCDVSRRHSDLFDGEPLRAFHFCKVTIHPDRLAVEVLMLDPQEEVWKTGDAWNVQLHSSPVTAIF